MKTIEISDATRPLAEYAEQETAEPLILTKDGEPVAVLMTLEGMDWESVSLSMNPQFQAIIERARARRQAEGGISHEEMLRRLGMDKPSS